MIVACLEIVKGVTVIPGPHKVMVVRCSAMSLLLKVMKENTEKQVVNLAGTCLIHLTQDNDVLELFASAASNSVSIIQELLNMITVEGNQGHTIYSLMIISS